MTDQPTDPPTSLEDVIRADLAAAFDEYAGPDTADEVVREDDVEEVDDIDQLGAALPGLEDDGLNAEPPRY